MLRRRFLWSVPLLCMLMGLLAGARALATELSFVPFYPEASGARTLSNSVVTADISHVDLGYFMLRHAGSTKRLRVTTTFGDKEVKYELNGEGKYETYPLTSGSGKYVVRVYEHAGTGANTYALVFEDSLEANIADERMPFLIPNQLVWYTSESAAVQMSMELCEGVENEWEKLQIIYDYVSKTVMYDYVKAAIAQMPYIPSVDDTLASKTGICFDYASLLACMLRVQGIPTQLVIGELLATSPTTAHAWNKVYLGGTWSLVDPTFPDQNFTQADYLEMRTY